MRGLFVVGGRVRGTVGDEDDASTAVLSDYVGQLLQVRHLSVLMGAGASFHLGSPQIRNLSNQVIAEVVAGSQEALSPLELAALRCLNPTDAGDLEILLTTLQSALSFASATKAQALVIDGKDHEVETLVSLRRKLNWSLAAQCRLPRPGFPRSLRPKWDAHQTFFARLLRSRRADLPRPRIFTTNYDLVIERSLDGLGVPYIDGFSGTIERRMNLETYNYDIYRTHAATQEVVGRVDSMLHIYKLHGSLNWRFDAEGQAGTVVTREIPDAPQGDDGLVLIYPTPAKERDTLAFPYSDLLRLFSNTLQVPDTALLCIGYGFADEHINRIITGSLSSNQSLSLLVVDPMGVYGNPDLLLGLKPDVGKTVADVGIEPAKTRTAALAAIQDSRISYITGESAKFENFASVMPDPNRFESGDDKSSLAIQIQEVAAQLGLQK